MSEVFPPAVDSTVARIDRLMEAIPPAERPRFRLQASLLEVKVKAALILLDEIGQWMDRTGHSDKYLRRMIDCVLGADLGTAFDESLPLT